MIKKIPSTLDALQAATKKEKKNKFLNFILLKSLKQKYKAIVNKDKKIKSLLL
jgi:hypothetical protein